MCVCVWVKLLITEYGAINIIAIMHSLTRTHMYSLTHILKHTKLPCQLEAQKQFTTQDSWWHSSLHACLWGSGSQAVLVLRPGPGGPQRKPVCYRFTKPTPKPPPTHPLTQPSAASSAPVFQQTEWITSWPSLEILRCNNPIIYAKCTNALKK